MIVQRREAGANEAGNRASHDPRNGAAGGLDDHGDAGDRISMY
jgi:hypothetical protein